MSINRAFSDYQFSQFTIIGRFSIRSIHRAYFYIHSIKTASIPIETFRQKPTFRQNFILPCNVTVNSSRSNDQCHLSFLRLSYDPQKSIDTIQGDEPSETLHRRFADEKVPFINVLIAVRRVAKSCGFLYVHHRNTIPKYSRFNDFFNEITRDAPFSIMPPFGPAAVLTRRRPFDRYRFFPFVRAARNTCNRPDNSIVSYFVPSEQ